MLLIFHMLKACNIRSSFNSLTANDDSFTPWEPWSDCTTSCNKGIKTRRRICIEDDCSGKSTEEVSCNDVACPGIT